MQRTPLTPEQALSRCAALCAKCEQCTPDLRRKLSTWGISSSDADRIITRLEELRFVDDARYARAYAHDKLAYSGWGRNKILQGLWTKRLSRSDIEQSMDDIDPDEYAAVAERIVRAKIRLASLDLTIYEHRVKLLRFALQRGFESSLITRILANLHDQCQPL